MTINESPIEEATLQWFAELGYAALHGPLIAPGELVAERDSFGDVLLVGRLRGAIRRLSPVIPKEAHANIQRFVHVRLERRLGS